MSDINKTNNDQNTENQNDLVVRQPNLVEKFRRSSRFVKFLIYTLLVVVISSILFWFAIGWQQSLSLLAICNAFYFTAGAFIAFGLIVLASNNNAFSPLIYGTKVFFLMFVAKKPKLSYFDYCQKNKENPISKVYIYFPLIASVPNLVVAVILHIIYNTQIYPFL